MSQIYKPQLALHVQSTRMHEDTASNDDIKWAKYIGVPYRAYGRSYGGSDCWGLCYLFYEEEFKVQIPLHSGDYQGCTSRDATHLNDLMESDADLWVSIPDGQQKPGDIIILTVGSLKYHCGIVFDNSKMIHNQQGIESALESYRGREWKDRIDGFYRFKELTN